MTREGWALAAASLALLLIAPHGGSHPGHAAQAIASDMIAPGETFTFRPDTPGTYAYHCHPHPWMTGTLLVTAAGDAPAEVDVAIRDDGNGTHVDEMGFHDDASQTTTTTARVGDLVRWVNEGNFTHNVVLEQVAGSTTDGAPGPGAPLAAAALAVALVVARRRAAD
jgi:MYXO-CTERM domain-containing protein